MEQQALAPEKSVSSKLDGFRVTYPLRPPRAEAIRNQDEVRQLTPEEGLEEFDRLLGAKAEKSDLPRATPRGNTYLWVIGQNSIPAALETVEVGQRLASGVIKHTNLTGGQPAHCGGEVWFINDDDLVISGSSGRYGPDTGDVQQLLDAALVFKEQGYRVATLGMDETGFMATLLVGEPQWL
ncbi:hypothetical protein [Burkholderia contaminans]|uniref:Uncharacterized protein n=1 Tax=Burkholderia contaminans TaxID=488447 RepID=A0A3N8QFS6_9BURK|nr:hypothetical protein [Burkholderia contaminans]RQT22667.1 hypothetical protein DF037_27200 [Burkholderia contaminans]